MKTRERGFGIIGALVVIAIGLIAFGCWGIWYSHQSQSSKATDPASFCGQANHAIYKSVDLQEGGVGQQGPIKTYWSVGLQNGKFSWTHSNNTRDIGTYICSDNTLAVKPASGKSYKATYSPATKTLLWQNVKYKLVK